MIDIALEMLGRWVWVITADT